MTGFDLGEPADDADDEPETETESESEPTDSSPEPEKPDRQEPAGEPVDRETDPTESGPSFPYSEVKQSPLYAREETWTEFEDELDFTVTPELRRKGIRDDELREIHDIVLEMAIENIEEFPERLAEKRREM